MLSINNTVKQGYLGHNMVNWNTNDKVFLIITYENKTYYVFLNSHYHKLFVIISTTKFMRSEHLNTVSITFF